MWKKLFCCCYLQAFSTEQILKIILKAACSYIACSYGYKLVCVDKFNMPFKTYLGEDAAYNFINSMIEESTYCSEMVKQV